MATAIEKMYVLTLISNGPESVKREFGRRVSETEKSLEGYLFTLDAMNTVLDSWVAEMKEKNIHLG